MNNFFKNAVMMDGFPCFAPELALDNDGFDKESFEFLFENEPTFFWFKERNNIIIWAISKYFPNFNNFLEIGCGTGYVSSAIHKNFPKSEIYGSEIYVEGLKHAARRLKKETLFQLDARTIPFENFFDAIGMFDVLEHIEEDEAVLWQIHKSLKTNGWLIMTVPQHMFLWSPADEYACHKRRYSCKQLEDKLAKTGFTIKKISSFMFFLMPILIISRLLNSTKKKWSLKEEFNISPAANGMFACFLKLELFLMKIGISFPLGSSLIVVAQKGEE